MDGGARTVRFPPIPPGCHSPGDLNPTARRLRSPAAIASTRDDKERAGFPPGYE